MVDYRSSFKKLQLYFASDPLFASITRAQLIAFAWLHLSALASQTAPPRAAKPGFQPRPPNESAQIANRR